MKIWKMNQIDGQKESEIESDDENFEIESDEKNPITKQFSDHIDQNDKLAFLICRAKSRLESVLES